MHGNIASCAIKRLCDVSVFVIETAAGKEIVDWGDYLRTALEFIYNDLSAQHLCRLGKLVDTVCGLFPPFSQLPEMSRTRLRDLIKEGAVLLNGAAAKPKHPSPAQ